MRPEWGRGDLLRLLSRGFGQTILTIGLVIGLYVVYEVWITNITSDHEQSIVHEEFQKKLESPVVGSGTLALPGGQQATAPAGTGIANIYVPRFGKDYVFTIVQGTSPEDLDKGPAHFINSAMPGQAGNFAIAGHRVGKGEPFLNIDQLLPGDAVIIQVPGFWYIYHVLGQGSDLAVPDANGVVGREVVDPSEIRVVAPTPGKLDSQPTGKYLTMTSCTPKYSSSHRMIVHGVLAETKVAKTGELPTELGGSL